uniref:Pentacotripeptide-repeat region of PRORP domain-containing protein n=1 Tax=Salix viminalis TaxID=40686 RepID=A0A6N2KYS6_SALVM
MDDFGGKSADKYYIIVYSVLDEENQYKVAMSFYSTLINGLCKGEFAGAVETLHRMKLQGLKPYAGLYGKINKWVLQTE